MEDEEQTVAHNTEEPRFPEDFAPDAREDGEPVESEAEEGIAYEDSDEDPMDDDSFYFVKALEEFEPNTIGPLIRDLIEYPEKLRKTIPDEDMILLNLLMKKTIGTGAQRGSITRIIGSLKERYVPEKNRMLMEDLDNKASVLPNTLTMQRAIASRILEP